jgi:hypothetical protein
LEKLQYIPSGSTFSRHYLIAPFVFSVIASLWPKYFKKILLFILATELCLLVIFFFYDFKPNAAFSALYKINSSFFVLLGFLSRENGFWLGYLAGRLVRLGLPELTMNLFLVFAEIFIISLSVVFALIIHRLSIWLAEFLKGEEVMMIQ